MRHIRKIFVHRGPGSRWLVRCPDCPTMSGYPKIFEVDADGTIGCQSWDTALKVALAHADWHASRNEGWRLPSFGQWYLTRYGDRKS